MIEHDYALDATLPVDTVPEDPPAPLAFGFSGSGGEYFRIWIVNLLLTVATLGIYSAWAKTRRLQYFYRNTQLAGASFDFRGNPAAILRGRLLAVVLLAAYHYAFGFSAVAGAVTVSLLVCLLPFMMRSALRFRLSNTWYRGLPFGFAGEIQPAYRAYALPVAMFVLPGALVALLPDRPMVSAVFLLYLLWPLMHGAMKRYQHSSLTYGDQRAEFGASSTELAAPYVVSFVAGIVVFVVLGMMMYAGSQLRADTGARGIASALIPLGAVLLVYLFLIFSALFVMVRMNNIAWSETRFPGVRIASAMRLRSYFRLQAVNVLLTLLTLGLFRPFAAVRTWRYRLAHVHVEAPDGFEAATGQASRRPATAAGDGSAEFLGLDLSW
ncbi:Inner membrane protein YjgN [Massilia sp. Bi118]|uniref:YjgN family protein n=1 Tax=Massilia sp. Bi118 TaxID=2822346 RepID=UPI001D9A26B6|nr:YjgN family protein [Massilia sp. Bi118]CAH0227532.1 Inner membrane protein YjgN [Massilia sp. Bi118]